MSRRLRRLVAGTTVLLLVPTVASAQSADLAEQLQEQADAREQAEEDLQEVAVAESAAQQALRAAQSALDAAEAELTELTEQLTEAEQLLELARERLETAVDRAARAQQRHERAARRLHDTERDLAAQQQRLEGRIRAAFMYGQVSFAEALTGVRDIADFLNSSTYVGRVMANDRSLVEQVLALLDRAAVQRAEAEELREVTEHEATLAAAAEDEAVAAAALVTAAVADQRRLTAEVAGRRTEQQLALEGLREDRASIEGHLAGLDAESDRIEAQLAEIARRQAEEAELRRIEDERRREAERLRREEEERKRQEEAANRPPGTPADPVEEEPAPSEPEPSAPAPGAGSWVRPVPGGLTSPFGPRWGRNHNGVDLAGAVGSNVVASRDGLVVHVTTSCHPTSSWGCGGGFGNYVTVAHADGMASVYAHLSAVGVAVGQGVAAGQSVGQVGNSGNSYGSHLHFEIREGGVPRNPCGYISC